MVTMALMELAREFRQQTGRIIDLLQQPERTKAREKQGDAYKAFRKGVETGAERWIDDAITDFKKAIELDKYDYLSYWFLGNIYTDLRFDQEYAEEAFENAAHYSWPDNPRVTVCSLLFLARFKWATKETAAAEALAAEAVEKDPQYAVGHLHLAIYKAWNRRCEQAVIKVSTALQLDPSLFDRAATDPAFTECPEVDEKLRQLYKEAKTSALTKLHRLKATIDRAIKTIRRLGYGNAMLERFGISAADRTTISEIRNEKMTSTARQLEHAIEQGSYAQLVRDLPHTISKCENRIVDAIRSVLDNVISKLGGRMGGDLSSLTGTLLVMLLFGLIGVIVLPWPVTIVALLVIDFASWVSSAPVNNMDSVAALIFLATIIAVVGAFFFFFWRAVFAFLSEAHSRSSLLRRGSFALGTGALLPFAVAFVPTIILSTFTNFQIKDSAEMTKLLFDLMHQFLPLPVSTSFFIGTIVLEAGILLIFLLNLSIGGSRAFRAAKEEQQEWEF
jgi:tetratricopeptide (TPR) repeat protein